MNWSEVGDFVGEAAPMVGTLLGGPAGAAVGTMVAGSLNVDADPVTVVAVLAGDPDAMVKMQEFQVNAPKGAYLMIES